MNPTAILGVCSVRQAIAAYRYSFVDEKELQRGLEAALTAGGFAFRREVRLSRQDVADFMVDGGICVEVKVDSSLSAVTRQLMRYAQHQDVAAILLVTSLRRHDHLPETLNGKPVAVLVAPGGLP